MKTFEEYFKKTIILEYLHIHNKLNPKTKKYVIYHLNENKLVNFYNKIKNKLEGPASKFIKDKVKDEETKLRYKILNLERILKYGEKSSYGAVATSAVVGRLGYINPKNAFLGIILGIEAGFALHWLKKFLSLYLLKTKSKCYKFKEQNDEEGYLKCELTSLNKLLDTLNQTKYKCDKLSEIKKHLCIKKHDDLIETLKNKISRIKYDLKQLNKEKK